jgi:hypothetical protein
MPVVPTHFVDFVNQLYNLDTRLQSATIDGAFRFPVGGSRSGSKSTTQKEAQNPPQPRAIAKDSDAMDLDLPTPRVNQIQSQRNGNGARNRPPLPEAARNPS